MTSHEAQVPAWPAPLAHSPVAGTVDVPGSKSITNRALLLAAISDSPSTVTGALDARDTRLMLAGLRCLGVTTTSTSGDGSGGISGGIRISPAGDEDRGEREIDCGLAGTVMRFLPPVAALHRGIFRFDGDEAARHRPMAALMRALRDLGADLSPGDTLPFTVAGRGRVAGGSIEIDASESSQFVSALLLAGARFDEGLTVTHIGSRLPSQPHIDMSLHMLRRHVVDVVRPDARTWSIAPGVLRAANWHIEPDLSNAMPFIAAAALTGGQVTVPGIPEDSLQPLARVRELLGLLGCSSSVDGAGLTVRGPQTIRAIDVDLADVGELVPTIAVVCAYADGPSRLRGIGHIRGHETDRIAALVDVFAAVGGRAHALDDGLVIEPGPLRAGRIPTYADHRLATAGAILGLRTPGVEVQDIATTAKTMPEFASMWGSLIAGGSS